jgi:hypothetical protein
MSYPVDNVRRIRSYLKDIENILWPDTNRPRLPDAFIKKIGSNAYGMFDPNTLTIYLCKWPPRNRGAKQIIFQTFWHEYTHALLWVALPKYYTLKYEPEARGKVGEGSCVWSGRVDVVVVLVVVVLLLVVLDVLVDVIVEPFDEYKPGNILSGYVRSGKLYNFWCSDR